MEISNILLDDEQVLWSFSHKINLHKKRIINIFLVILGFLIIAFVMSIIGIFVNQLQAYFLGLFWIGLIFCGFIMFQYRDHTLLKNKLDLTNKELKIYQESFYFTNKRCMLKSYKTFKIELKKFPNHEIKKDCFIIKHEDIKQIIISSYKNRHSIWISEKHLEKSIDWSSFIKFEFPNEKFNDLYEIVNKTLKLQVADNSIENVTHYSVLTDN